MKCQCPEHQVKDIDRRLGVILAQYYLWESRRRGGQWDCSRLAERAARLIPIEHVASMAEVAVTRMEGFK